MKKVWLLGGLLSLSCVWAQPDAPRRKFVIAPVLPKPQVPPTPTPGTTSPTLFKPMDFNKSDNPIKYSILNNIQPAPAPKPETFLNPFADVEKKLNGGDEVAMGARGDQFLGEFRSQAKYVRIMCRDHEYPDGDMVAVSLNGVRILSSLTLESAFQEVNVTLKPGFNKIDFEALNQGASGPNTAEFVVYDDQGKLVSSNKWNLSTGYKASIVVVKE